VALRNRARSTRLLVVTLVSASLITITVDYRGGASGPLDTVGDAALAIVSPLQEAVSKAIRPIGNFFSTLIRLPAIRHDDQALRARVAELEQQESVYLSQQTRLNELEALLGLQESLGARVESMAAQVIASSVSNFEWTVTIDKGSGDGIEVDMPVVASAGLVGHVIRVTPGSADVQLIIDPGSFVTGRLEGSGETGLLQGRGGGDLVLSGLDPATQVLPDERVVTAGYRFGGQTQSLYPPNVLIGSVSHVVPDDAALEESVSVRPAVDFSSLDVVLVVLSSGSG
jgi:rod shape-determining protein MreC